MNTNQDRDEDEDKKTLLDWINSLFEMIGFAPKLDEDDSKEK